MRKLPSNLGEFPSFGSSLTLGELPFCPSGNQQLHSHQHERRGNAVSILATTPGRCQGDPDSEALGDVTL